MVRIITAGIYLPAYRQAIATRVQEGARVVVKTDWKRSLGLGLLAKVGEADSSVHHTRYYGR